MSKTILYGTELSPPVRACLLTLKALEIPYEFKVIDLAAGEHMTDEFTKHNPQHTVPVLQDGEAWIWDSHAINVYLVEKYGKDDALYPKDQLQRATVNQRMFFEASVLFPSLRNVTVPLLRKNCTRVMKEKTENIVDGYTLTEKFLADNQYIAGNQLTIADFSVVSTLTSLRAIIDINPIKYPKIMDWLERMEKLSYYEEANSKGAQMLSGLLKSRLTDIIV